MRSSPVSLRSFPFSAFHSPLAIISHQSSVSGGRGFGKEDHPAYEMTTHFSRPALIAGESPALQSGVASFFPVFRFPLSSCDHQSSVISHQSSVPGGRGVRKEDHPTHEMTTHFSRTALIAGGSPDVKKDGFSKRRAIMVATNRPSSLKGETNDIIHRS